MKRVNNALLFPQDGEGLEKPYKTLITAIILRAISDLESKNPKTERQALLFLLDGGLIWGKYLDVDVRQLAFQHLTGDYNVEKIYKPNVERRVENARTYG